MTKETLKVALVLIAGVLLGAGIALVAGRSGVPTVQKAGAPAGPAIENYIPAILYSDGYYSERGIHTTSTFRADGDVTLNATTTLESQGNPAYSVRGGIDFADVQLSYAATSGVVVSFPNPFGASNSTTTVLSVVCQTTTGLTGSNLFALGTSTSAVGSSTRPWLFRTIASGAQDTVFWTPMTFASTTLTQTDLLVSGANPNGDSPFFLKPDERLNWRIASSSPGAGSYSGTCSASFMKP